MPIKVKNNLPAKKVMERENILGTLEAGKRADIVIFDNDLFQVPVERIREVKVQRTMVNGREVYSREER